MCKACYVHVPFCQNICAYCDFFRCRYHKGLVDRWLFRISEEIQEKLTHPLETLYIGGGTPSSLNLSQLEILLKALYPYAKNCKEYTIEANVESIDFDKLVLCKKYGVNRVSLGVQTLQPTLLKEIHRQHQKKDIEQCIFNIHKAGIHNISIDLIYGLPNQTLRMWKEDLQEIVNRFDIQHISLYGLTIEPNSEFGRKGILNIDEEIEADMYDYAIEFLEEHGFYQYEISNFSKKGYSSQHNQMYWEYNDFYGVGCGASGKEHHARYDNIKNLDVYLHKGPSPEYVELNKDEEMFEMIMMSLRMKKGMQRKTFRERFNVDVYDQYKEIIDRLIDEEMLNLDSERMYTTNKGFHLLNDVLVRFL